MSSETLGSESVGSETVGPEAGGTHYAAPAEVLRRYLEEVAIQGRVELIDELAHPDVIDEANQMFGGPAGREGLVAHVVGFRRNISDARYTIERIVGDDRTAMAWWRFTGTHVGPWLGVPPTNGPVSATVFSLFEVSEGRVERYRLYLRTDLDGGRVLDTSSS